MKLYHLAAIAALIATPALAQSKDTPNAAGTSHTDHAASAQTGDGSGVVKAVNAKAGSITLHHAPIAALGWPAMTMTFKADPALLKALKPGQAVKFTVRPEGDSGEVVAIAPQ